METLFFILLIIIVMIICAKLARFFKNLAASIAAEKRAEEEYRRDLIDSVNALSNTEEKKVATDQREALYRANQELLNKQKVREAMKDELGVD